MKLQNAPSLPHMQRKVGGSCGMRHFESRLESQCCKEERDVDGWVMRADHC
jgi:hypothetical protein